jgi:RNA polymerase sigma-70 factor (ECF subfamily)
VFSVSYAMLGHTEDADIAVQNVFSRLTGTDRVIAGQPEIIERLYRFAMDYCVLELRLRHVRDVFARLAGARSVSGLNDARADATGRVAALAMFAVLPTKERALLVLREVADQPVDAVARIMNMKAGEVRNALLFARRRLLKLRCPK